MSETLEQLLERFANCARLSMPGQVNDTIATFVPQFETWRSTPVAGDHLHWCNPDGVPNPQDRIATALERLVELAEPDGITPDIVVDTDGKLMHCTGTLPGCEVATTGPPLPPIPDRDYSAYVVAHDPTAAILAACEFWGYARAELTNLKADYDD